MSDALPPKRTTTDAAWMANGKCRDEPPSRFFPSEGTGVVVAQRFCEDCPVKVPCLEYALVNRIDHGVWGGASERQRRRMRKSRTIDVAADVGDRAAVA